MSKNKEETLLTLYKEKMNYLVAYEKIYSWMLGLIGTGLIVSIGFGLQHRNELKTKLGFIVVFVLVPLLINAWFSAFIFCYWYSYLLCQNIEYIEKLITKDLLFSHKFSTWYNDFFRIFYGKTPKEKYFTMVLFGFIGLPILALYGIVFYGTWTRTFHETWTTTPQFIDKFGWIVYRVVYWIIPLLIMSIHIRRFTTEEEKTKDIYEKAGIAYN